MKSFCMVLLLAGASLAQQSQTLQQLKTFGRDSLIRRAVLAIQENEHDFDPAQYDRVRITEDHGELHVRFEHSILYLARKTAFKYGAMVSLVSNSASSSILSNPEDYDDSREEYRYFKWDEKSRAAVRFVLGAIGRSDEVGDVVDGTLPNGTQMTIREERDYYEINVDSWSTHSSYKIQKKSGYLYDASHKHYARDGKLPELELWPEK